MSYQQELPTMNMEADLNQSQFQRVQYPDLSTVIPAAQYIQMDDVQQAVAEVEQPSVPLVENRAQFLVAFYKIILRQHIAILLLFLLGLTEWFSSIVVVHHRWWSSLRWTWWVILSFFILITLWLPCFRKCRCFVSAQAKIFRFQTILIAFLLIGIAGAQRGNWNHKTVNVLTIVVLLILIAHDIAQLVLVKKSVTHYYKIFMKFGIMGSIGLNLIVALCSRDFSRAIPIVEAVVIYALYYFNQLNESLLTPINELPEELTLFERIRKLQFVKKMFQEQQQTGEVVEQLQKTHWIINKQKLILIGSGFAYLSTVILSIVTGNALFIVIVAVTSVSLLSLVIETQVASRSLKNQDAYYAVCLTYLDMVSPLKNIIRSLIQK